jgi:hypothetical protein
MPTTQPYKIGAREIERGAIVEIETISTIKSALYGVSVSAGPTYVGRLGVSNENVICLRILRAAKTIAQKDIRSARVLTPEECAQRFSAGRSVRLDRFGSTYQGRVEKVGRTRVTVRFQTDKDHRAGVFHVVTVPASELVLVRS